VRRCVVVIQQPVLLSPKFGAKSSNIFTQSQQNVTVVCGIDCLACQDELFVNNPLKVKENYKHARDHAVHLSGLFRSALNQACHANTFVWLKLSSPNVCLIIARVTVALFRDFHKI
jgi:hypothetical protein